VRVLFKQDVAGSPTDFIWDDGSICIDDTENCDWRFSREGPRFRSALAASEAAGCEIVVTPCAPQARFWMKHTPNPAWCRILPKDQYREHLHTQIDRVINFLTSEEYSYFLTHFQDQQDLLDRLVQCKVKDDSLREFGFVPDSQGFAAVPVYDNVHSSTGRMTITSGPKILTLQKSLRSSIVSRWKDGVVVEVDFNALEARVLNWIAANEQPQSDLYEWIGLQCNAGQAQRSVIKEAVLAAIYGMSKRNFALRYQDMPDSIEVYDSVRSLMKVRQLEAKLKDSKRFANAFGRPLSSTSAEVSHHVQSTAVDVACKGFLWLTKQLDPDWAVPVFLIHDALVIDIKSDHLEKLNEICKSGLQVDTLNQSFPVKTRRFDHE
jgi:hypothetical protein